VAKIGKNWPKLAKIDQKLKISRLMVSFSQLQKNVIVVVGCMQALRYTKSETFLRALFGQHAPYIMLRDLLTQKCMNKKVTDFGYPSKNMRLFKKSQKFNFK
jgi:hypothetical protein